MTILSIEELQRNVKALIAVKEKAGTQREKDGLIERIAEYQFKIAELYAQKKAQ